VAANKKKIGKDGEKVRNVKQHSESGTSDPQKRNQEGNYPNFWSYSTGQQIIYKDSFPPYVNGV
jgi:hypothetical protein